MLGETTSDNFERMFYTYVLNRVVPASATQDPNILTILSDADFEWWWLTASRTSNLLSVLMEELGTGRNFISSAYGNPNGIQIDNWAGTAQNNGEFPLAVPYLMPATRSYSFKFTDTSAAPNTVQVCLNGYKLFPKPKAA
jgi:hypothetical protein